MDFAVLHHTSQSDAGNVVERHHNFETAGFYLQKIELFYGCPKRPAANLFNDSYPMVGVNDLIADVKAAVATDHEGPPDERRRPWRRTIIILAQAGGKDNLDPAFAGEN